MEHQSAPIRVLVTLKGDAFAGWRYVNEAAPPLLFCHATGFCASAYKQMFSHLQNDFDITALDQRGHGRTRAATDPAGLTSWKTYASDIAAFLDQSGRDGWVLAGHSMGAVAATLASRGRSDIAALRLIEPVAMPPIVQYLARLPWWRERIMKRPPASLARKRRVFWPNREAVRESYGKKALFARFADGALLDYLEDGLTETEEGVRLSCDPEWEAATFSAHAHDFWGAVRAAPAPVSVLGARGATSTLFPSASRRFRAAGAQIGRVDGVSHLVAMEKPALAAAFLRGAAPSGL